MMVSLTKHRSGMILIPTVKNVNMNNLLKQFERESNLDVYALGLDRAKWESKLERYTDLVVRECLSNMEDCDGDSDFAIWKTKKDFGVDDNSIKVGSRVKVVSGFNVGAKGTVSYIEPIGRMWVMRDGASTDVFYHPEEVVRIEE